MTALDRAIANLAGEYGYGKLTEDFDIAGFTKKVTTSLDRAAKVDEVDTVTFGLETDDGKVVKVYVAHTDADKFEEIMSKALGDVDDIEEAINQAAKEVDIVDVVWPEQGDDVPDDNVKDDGSEVLNKKVFDKANLRKEVNAGLEPKLESVTFPGELPGGIGARLTTPNQQLILQAILELGIPEIALDRSPYRATIVKNVRDLASQMSHRSTIKQALRLFVKKSIDFTKPELEEAKTPYKPAETERLQRILRVLKIDEATNSGPAHKNHTFSFSTKPGAPRDPKVVDAVKSLGNLNELTDKVYNRVMQLILHGRLAQKSEGELHSMLFNARHDAEERFAIKVALKAIDCRLPESKSNQKAMVAESTKPTITRAKNGSATINDVTFNAENLERIAKSFANKIASSAHDKEKNLWIVSPRAGRLVLKQQGTEARLELKKEQVTELLDLPDEEE